MYEELVDELRHHFDNVPLVLQAADAIEQLQTECQDWYKAYMDLLPTRWYSVEECLPGCKCHVLVTDGKFVGEASFFPETKWHSTYFPPAFLDPVEEYEDYRVTHWMPLPSTEGLNET